MNIPQNRKTAGIICRPHGMRKAAGLTVEAVLPDTKEQPYDMLFSLALVPFETVDSDESHCSSNHGDEGPFDLRNQQYHNHPQGNTY